MKKFILSLAFVTAGVFAFNAAAQDSCCNSEKTCCQTPEGDCCQAQGKPGKAPKANPFEGLNLTEQQQEAVKAVNDKFAQTRKEARKTKESANKDCKGGVECKKAYLKEIQNILTPEQYVAYLENLAVQPQGPKGQGHRPGKPHARPHGKQNCKKANDAPAAQKAECCN